MAPSRSAALPPSTLRLFLAFRVLPCKAQLGTIASPCLALLSRNQFPIISNKGKDAIQYIFMLGNRTMHAISKICELLKTALTRKQSTIQETLPCTSLIIKTQEWNEKITNGNVKLPRRLAQASRKRQKLQPRINLHYLALLAQVCFGISADDLTFAILTHARFKHTDASHSKEIRSRST